MTRQRRRRRLARPRPRRIRRPRGSALSRKAGRERVTSPRSGCNADARNVWRPPSRDVTRGAPEDPTRFSHDCRTRTSSSWRRRPGRRRRMSDSFSLPMHHSTMSPRRDDRGRFDPASRSTSGSSGRPAPPRTGQARVERRASNAHSPRHLLQREDIHGRCRGPCPRAPRGDPARTA